MKVYTNCDPRFNARVGLPYREKIAINVDGDEMPLVGSDLTADDLLLLDGIHQSVISVSEAQLLSHADRPPLYELYRAAQRRLCAAPSPAPEGLKTAARELTERAACYPLYIVEDGVGRAPTVAEQADFLAPFARPAATDKPPMGQPN